MALFLFYFVAALAAHVHDVSIAWGRRSYACSLLVATLVEEDFRTAESRGNSRSAVDLGNAGGDNEGPTDTRDRTTEAEGETSESDSLEKNTLKRSSTNEQVSPRAQLHIVTSEGEYFRCIRAYALGGGDSRCSGNSDVGSSGRSTGIKSEEELNSEDADYDSSIISNVGCNESSNQALRPLSLIGGETGVRLALGKMTWESHNEISGGAALRALLLAAFQSSKGDGQTKMEMKDGTLNAIPGEAQESSTSDVASGYVSTVAGASKDAVRKQNRAMSAGDGTMGLDEGILEWGKEPSFASKGGRYIKWTHHTHRY